MPTRPRDFAIDYGNPPPPPRPAWASEAWVTDPGDETLRRMGGDLSEFSPRQLYAYFARRWEQEHGVSPEWSPPTNRHVRVANAFVERWGTRNACLIVKTLFDLNRGRWRSTDGVIRPVGWEILDEQARHIQEALLLAGGRPLGERRRLGNVNAIREMLARDP